MASKKYTLQQILTEGKTIHRFPIYFAQNEKDRVGVVLQMLDKSRFIVMTLKGVPFLAKEADAIRVLDEYEKAHELVQTSLMLFHGIDQDATKH